MVTDDSITHVCYIKENKYSSLSTGDLFLSKAEYVCQQTYYDVNSEIHKSIAEVCSGALVPSATIVRPTTREGILSFLAREEAPSTKKSAPFISRTNPARSSTMSMTMFICDLRIK